MPQSFLERLGLNLPKSEYRGRLDDTPLEETNPWLAKGRDFLSNFTGLGADRGLLADEENQTTAGILGDAAGQFNPQKMLLGPLAGITKFMKAGTRIPDRAARLAATTRNTDRMIGAGIDAGARSDDLEEAIRFANRYPRTMAHQDVVYNPDLPLDKGAINRLSPDGERIRVEMGSIDNLQRADPQHNKFSGMRAGLVDDAIDLGIQTPGIEQRGIFPFANSLAHETQHTGQRLLSPRFTNSIPQTRANYQNDPREVAARAGSYNRIYGPKRLR